MSIQKKVTGFLALVLVAAFGVAALISTHQATTQLVRSGDTSKHALEKAADDQAKSVFTSLEVGAKGSIEQGDMNLFSKLLVDLGKIPNVEEIGLANPKGTIDFSSTASSVKQTLKSATFEQAVDGNAQLLQEKQGDSLLLLQGQHFEQRCLQCHSDAKLGDLGGILYVRYSLHPLRQAEAKMAAFTSKAAHDSTINGLVTGLGGLLLATLGVYLLLGRLVRRPLVSLEEMIDEMGKGHLDRRLRLTADDEIGQIGRTMDNFADNLEREVVDVLRKLAEGDLTFQVTPRDEQDSIRNALQKLGRNLNGLLGQVQGAGEQIASGAVQVSDSSQSLSQGATEQASSLEEISASMHQLSSQTQHNAENATQANRLATQARSGADEGNTQMQQMVSAMTEINTASQNISKIIKVIDEIAFQTNLLALNAAVEAARAGVHGKGFAVVAEEVRNLAARSARAAKETAELIESSVQMTENGSQIADRTAQALSEIVNDVTKVTDLIAEIAAASNEQAQGIKQVSQGVAQIDQVTQQNTANAEESAAAAEELSSQAAHLKAMLGRFKLQGQARTSLAAPSPAPVRQQSRQPASPKPELAWDWPSGTDKATSNAGTTDDPATLIALDDSEFGKY
ncbi:MAG TPA: methyl-accepting chemotaxis protein [Desulfuromonadales bacterium]|nr:methyl-accepting chemotaxis protein [Desulfuromonadales bacterium]